VTRLQGEYSPFSIVVHGQWQEDIVLDVNGYADLLNCVRLRSPRDGIANLCLGHIIGKSANYRQADTTRVARAQGSTGYRAALEMVYDTHGLENPILGRAYDSVEHLAGRLRKIANGCTRSQQRAEPPPMATSAKGADKYKCWKDFSGKPVFYTPAGFMNWLNFQRIYKALGYDFKHVQIDLKSNADALEAGTIVGSVAYTTSGSSLSSYWKETEIRMDVRVVNPCPDEVAKLKAAGLAVVDVDPKGAFSKDVGPKMLQGVPILFGYNARSDMPEEVVYKMIKAFFDKKDELVKLDPGFSAMAKDFVGMQVQGINANPQTAVHPGLAKFLKEQKAWDDKWKIASSAS
jgi:hypothetical protein